MTVTELFELYPHGVSIDLNPHKASHEQPHLFIDVLCDMWNVEIQDLVELDELVEMKRNDSMVQITIRPSSPSGSVDFFAVDLDSALAKVAEYATKNT